MVRKLLVRESVNLVYVVLKLLVPEEVFLLLPGVVPGCLLLVPSPPRLATSTIATKWTVTCQEDCEKRLIGPLLKVQD